MLNKKKRRILLWSSIIVFLFLIIPVLGYSLGYSLGPGWVISKSGGLYIEASLPGATVYIDGAEVKQTSFISYSALIKYLSPGIHELRVTKDGYWEWNKTISILPELVIEKKVLLLPRDPVGKILSKEESVIIPSEKYFLKKNILYAVSSSLNLEPQVLFSGVKKYWELGDSSFLILGEDNNFYKNKNLYDLQSEYGLTAKKIFTGVKNSFFSSNLNRVIYWDKASIDSYWVASTEKMPKWEKDLKSRNSLDPRLTHLFSSIEELRDVRAYPSNSDYLIITFGNSIYALEMDFTGGQNLFPIYKGKEPNVISVDENKESLYLLDDERNLEIKLP